MELSQADRIWNRAAMEDGGRSPRVGDMHLSALLAVHGMFMNGGVDHALEVLSEDEYEAGIQGFRYFGLPAVASVLEAARGCEPDDRERFDQEYGVVVPNDAVLGTAFEAAFAFQPGSFAPLLPGEGL